MKVGEFILKKTGSRGNVRKLGLSRQYLDSLLPTEHDEILIPKCSKNLILKLNKNYGYSLDELFSEIDLPDYEENILYRMLESLSNSVGDDLSPKKLDKEMSKEDVFLFLQNNYHKIKGSDMLSMTISNIPKMIARFDSLNYTQKFEKVPFWLIKDPDRYIKAETFDVYDPVLRNNNLISADDLIKAEFDGDFIIAKFHKELYPRNVESIETKNWLPFFNQGKKRRLGKEFNQVSIKFKNKIPNKVLNHIDDYIDKYGHLIGVSHGFKGDYLIENTFSTARDGFYTGQRPIFKLSNNEKELIVYYAPFEIANGLQGKIYLPNVMQLDLIKKIQNKWLYNR